MKIQSICIYLLLTAIVPAGAQERWTSAPRPRPAAGSFSRAEIRVHQTGLLVYTIRPISAGGTFSANVIEERTVNSDFIPIDGISSASYLLNKKAKRAMRAGLPVCEHDLVVTLPRPGKASSTTQSFDSEKMSIVFYAARDIYKGAVVRSEWVERKRIFSSQIPQDAVLSLKSIIGKTAKFDIPKGSLISQDDF